MKIVTIENKLVRIVLAAIIAGPIAMLITNLATEALVHIYMFANDIFLRSDLIEDYGFGLFGMAFYIIVLVISAIGCFAGLYKITGKNDF